MDAEFNKDVMAKTLVVAALEGTLSEAQAEQLAAFQPELLKLVLLAAAKRIAEQDSRISELQAKVKAGAAVDPATPSGQRPVYAKPSASKRNRKRKPGGRKGHPGSRRAKPERIDRHEEHRLEHCPGCGCELQRCKRTRTRTVEDILKDLRTEAVRHTIHRDYCPACKKHVEPAVADALPKSELGHRVVSLTGWLHYGLGVTIDQVVEIFGYHLQTRLTPGGLVAIWQRLGRILAPWYEQIGREARASAVLHADETGWRVNGLTYWLWCFANGRCCYYMIDRSRGSPALEKFFIEAFDGILITDFWAAYDSIWKDNERQMCLVHLLRELEKVDQTNESAEWLAFAKMLRRLVRDGIRLWKREDYSREKYDSRVVRINSRLHALANGEYADADASRLGKRLLKYNEAYFTFLDYEGVPFENNFAERMIRPAVIIRKNSQSNRSEKGAAVQGILMSVFRTLKLRGHNPIDVITEALRSYVQTGQLPPLPKQSVAGG
jgi:hypothetical protein